MLKAAPMFALALTLLMGIDAADATGTDLPMTAAEAKIITSIIDSFGYDCPLAKIGRGYGPTPRGTLVKIWCGPREGSGVYPALVFRFIITPSGSYIVEPWE